MEGWVNRKAVLHRFQALDFFCRNTKIPGAGILCGIAADVDRVGAVRCRWLLPHVSDNFNETGNNYRRVYTTSHDTLY